MSASKGISAVTCSLSSSEGKNTVAALGIISALPSTLPLTKGLLVRPFGVAHHLTAKDGSTWTGYTKANYVLPFRMARPMRLLIHLDVDSLKSGC
jgi:hypothetical protein